ncbi:MAG: carbon-nitrogen hydrolase family protein [Pseudomonadota bacterium]
MKVAACQVMDIHENIEQTLEIMASYARRAEAQGAKLVCFPECYLQGYIVNEGRTPQLALDLSSRAVESILRRFAHIQPVLVIGLIESENSKTYNTAIVVQHGKLLGRYRKTRLLPGESLIFTPGDDCPVFNVDGLKFGINICYELVFPECAQAVADQNVDLLVCPCNNMHRRVNAEKLKYKHNVIRADRAKE